MTVVWLAAAALALLCALLAASRLARVLDDIYRDATPTRKDLS